MKGVVCSVKGVGCRGSACLGTVVKGQKASWTPRDHSVWKHAVEPLPPHSQRLRVEGGGLGVEGGGFYVKRLSIYNLLAMKFTTQHDLDW